MKLRVCIPTYRRTDKLLKCLESLQRSIETLYPTVETGVHVYFSDQQELEAVAQRLSMSGVTLHLLQKEFKASVFWNDILREMEEDVLCYLTDDIELDDWCLVEGWNHMVNLDFDGVVGFKIENATDGQPCRAAFGMVGKEFARRFPDSQVFCPEYWCFYLDKELEEFASSVSRFYFAENAKLRHAHPSFTLEEPDQCHVHHRRNAGKDVATRKARMQNNLLWGESFDLVEKEEECNGKCGSCS